MSSLRTAALQIADELPVGNRTRRAILAAIHNAGNSPLQLLWDKLVKDGIRLKKTVTDPHKVSVDIRTTNTTRIIQMMGLLGWRSVGDRYTLSGGYEATLTAGSRGVTILRMTGPDLSLSTKTPPKLTKDMHAIMAAAWRDRLLTRDAAFGAVHFSKMDKVDGYLTKLVRYGYLTPVSGGYKVTPEGVSAR